MSESTCYYYDEQRNRCNCYVNENLNELLAENTKLRELLDAAKHDLSVFSGEIVASKAENAKLRELVEDMLSCIEIRAAFDRPPTEEMYETFAQQARELGVEVD